MLIKIKKATSRDAAGIARVQVDSYTESYKGLFPEEYLAAFTLQEQEQDWLTWPETHPEDVLLAAFDDRDEIIGYSLSRILEEPAGAGEVLALHVSPSLKKQGIGRVLLQASVEALKNKGAKSILIWTLINNPSRGFYEHLKGVLVGEKDLIIDELNFSTKEVCYEWHDVDVFLRELAGCDKEEG